MNVTEIKEQISKLPLEQQAEAKKLFAKTYGVTLESFSQEKVLKIPKRLLERAQTRRMTWRQRFWRKFKNLLSLSGER